MAARGRCGKPKGRLSTSKAVCDQKAFYPLRSLIEGPLTNLCELKEVERFIRTVLLHDEISMELEPWAYDPDSDDEWTEEERQYGRRNVIVAIGPRLTGYDFFTQQLGPGKPETPDIRLSPALIEVARDFSNAEEGNVYYESHIEYLQRIVSVIQNGGSALLAGEFGNAAIEASSKYPEKFFENIDKDWQRFAREAAEGEVSFKVPPVLSIILTRIATRDAIPYILRDLRDEWANARGKVWALLGRLMTASSLGETKDIHEELAAASRMLSLPRGEIDTRPVRMLWDLVVGSAEGVATALLSGGEIGVGAVVGALREAVRSGPSFIHESGPILFGRGAFDLARRVRQEVMLVEHDALARLLTDAEKRSLGL
ncbi:MAG: hypothetical protein ABSC19_12985 [Syntrophorhabdales bacterium]|jgi:hypothetical protein